jgi:hypothetical protein
MFDRELFLDVYSKYGGMGFTITWDTVVLHESMEIKTINETVRKIQGGKWLKTDNPQYFNGTLNSSSVFYAVKSPGGIDNNASIESMYENGYIAQAKSVKENMFFAQDHADDSMIYYFTGNEYSGTAWQDWINLHCTAVQRFRPVFWYSWDTYSANKAIFDNTAHITMLYEDAKEICSTYMLSDGIIYDNTDIGRPWNVYKYKKQIVNSAGLDPGSTDPDKKFSFGRAFYLPENQNANAVYLYSTRLYIKEVPSIGFHPGMQEATTKYNIFRNTLEGNGVVILRTGNTYGTEYNRGTLSYDVCCSEYAEKFSYLNIMRMPSWSGHDFLGIVNEESTSVFIDRTEPSTPVYTKINGKYDYIYLGPNRSSANIFGTFIEKGTEDYRWSPDYYTASWFHDKKTYYESWASYDINAPAYSEARAKQRIRAGNAGSVKVIVPYYIFNRWPFRYESQLAKEKYVDAPYNIGGQQEVYSQIYYGNYIWGNLNKTKQNILSLKSTESVPMPSVDTAVVGERSVYTGNEISIKYQRFNFGGSGSSNEIKLRINYETRKSHMMYGGNRLKDSDVNYMNDPESTVEYHGIVKTWDDNEFDRNDVAAYSKIRELRSGGIRY